MTNWSLLQTSASDKPIQFQTPEYIEQAIEMIDSPGASISSFINYPKMYGFVIQSQLSNGELCVASFNNINGFKFQRNPEYIIMETLQDMFSSEIKDLSLRPMKAKGCCAAGDPGYFQLRPIDDKGKIVLREFASDFYNQNLVHKIGLVPQISTQIDENSLFAVNLESDNFKQFLRFLGQEVNLKTHTAYNGDTGKIDCILIYSKVEQHEFLFHVSTRLPFKQSDEQQLERKRHIGNDNVVIVFDESEEGFTFLPDDYITSQQIKAYFLVKMDKNAILDVKLYTRDIDQFAGYVNQTFDTDKPEDQLLFFKVLANCCIACFTDKTLYMRKQRGWSVKLQQCFSGLGYQF